MGSFFLESGMGSGRKFVGLYLVQYQTIFAVF